VPSEVDGGYSKPVVDVVQCQLNREMPRRSMSLRSFCKGDI
jgi:hypothetical protein